MGVSVLKMPSYTVVQGTAITTAAVEKDVVGGPCTLHHVHAKNIVVTNTTAWLKLFNDANPTLGTTAPDKSFKLPTTPGQVADLEEGIRDIPINPPNGISFPNGLSFACESSGGGTAGTTAPTTALEINLFVVED